MDERSRVAGRYRGSIGSYRTSAAASDTGEWPPAGVAGTLGAMSADEARPL
ncbi:MAG TPA: hypothetical protein VJN63_01090 [Thermoplasmata archaeon]|nr:hypothetical protein [Thermoplasmata archaeon]